MPGSQTLWPAQDSLLPLAGHTLPWVAPLALLSDLEAHVQQGWFEDGRRTKRSWPRSWLGARQQTESGQQASPGPQSGVMSTVMSHPCGRALSLWRYSP